MGRAPLHIAKKSLDTEFNKFTPVEVGGGTKSSLLIFAGLSGGARVREVGVGGALVRVREFSSEFSFLEVGKRSVDAFDLLFDIRFLFDFPPRLSSFIPGIIIPGRMSSINPE